MNLRPIFTILGKIIQNDRYWQNGKSDYWFVFLSANLQSDLRYHMHGLKVLAGAEFLRRCVIQTPFITRSCWRAQFLIWIDKKNQSLTFLKTMNQTKICKIHNLRTFTCNLRVFIRMAINCNQIYRIPKWENLYSLLNPSNCVKW